MTEKRVSVTCCCHAEELRFGYDQSIGPEVEVVVWRVAGMQNRPTFGERLRGAFSALFGGGWQTWWVALRPSALRSLSEELSELADLALREGRAGGVAEECL